MRDTTRAESVDREKAQGAQGHTITEGWKRKGVCKKQAMRETGRFPDAGEENIPEGGNGQLGNCCLEVRKADAVT